jgi:hypothetical protein
MDPINRLGFSLPKGSCFNWYAQLSDIAGQDPLLDFAMESVSLAHMGKTERNSNVLRMARLSYEATLRHLPIAVEKGRRDLNFLGVIAPLCSYEVICSVNPIKVKPTGYSSFLALQCCPSIPWWVIRHNEAGQSTAMTPSLTLEVQYRKSTSLTPSEPYLSIHSLTFPLFP